MKLSSIALTAALAACAGSTGPELTAPAAAPVAVAPAAKVAASASVIETRSFASKSLGVEKSYVVYLPAGYASSPNRRYPVLYMLHGLGGSETTWRDLDIAKYADEAQFEGIIVMPDGDDSFYVNWAKPVDYDTCLKGARLLGKPEAMKHYCVKQPRYEDYVANDLREHIEGSLRTIESRANRAIGGLSMGGFGALYLAMRRPGLYGAVVSHAGWAAITYKQPQSYSKGKTELVTDLNASLKAAGIFGIMLARIFGDTLENWTAHDPSQLATQLAPGQLEIYFDCGTEDDFRFQNHNQYLAEVLETHSVPHEFHLIEGGRHNRAFWTSRVDDSLSFVKAFFAGKRSTRSQGHASR